MSRLARLGGLAPLFAAICLPACADRAVSEVVPIPENVEHRSFDVSLNADLDILFVVDDSNSMTREQDEIVENFHRMIDVLEGLPTGLPNLHLGVVSTDVGGGEISGPPPYPAGVLRNQPRISGCTPPAGRFIEDVALPDGTRRRNYSGSLADTFACIAKLGDDGSGFEQPLEAMRLALDPATTDNTGFLREGSLLAVVILSDEDDCSVFDDGLFAESKATLGPYNIRCFAHGVTCDDGTPPTQVGPRTACESNEESEYIEPVSKYVDALKQVRPLKDRLAVAGILGKPSPIEVVLDDGEVALGRSCDIGPTDEQGAFPPVRTDQFLAAFDDPVRTSICEADLSPAIAEITERIIQRLYSSCIVGELADANPTTPAPDYDCSVTEIEHAGSPDEDRDILPRCDAELSNMPCYSIEENTEFCTFTSHHLQIATHYPPETNRDGTRIEAQCRLE
jgi:hypothetical protein